MRFTKNFIKTRRDISDEIESVNARFLLKGNFIKQELAGVYSYSPLGIRVLNKIEGIIRKHMDMVSTEVFMPSLQPVLNWEKTKRLDSVDVLMKTVGANEASVQKNPQTYILGCTHEEIITPLAGEFIKSYKDLPISLYQVQTKFRNESRAKSGLLRGREFRMKDAYSFHATDSDFGEYYERMKQVYMDIYTELGIVDSTFITVASGGDFTDKFSHEFQTLTDAGEDLIYLDRANNIAYNKEIISEENELRLGVNFSALEQVKACEVGNIFPLETKFSNAFDLGYTDETGKEKKVIMGCYGIGSSRIMGVIVERYNDQKGIIWPENIAPFPYHLVTLAKTKDDEEYRTSVELYSRMISEGKEVLWDDRLDISAGEKFTDADIIGIPTRLVVSAKSMEGGGVEVKKRNEQASVIVELGGFEFD